MRTWKLGLPAALLIAGLASAGELTFKDRLRQSLAEQVPAILKTFDAKTGRFGTGIWTCQDQHPMYPLAVAYATQGEGNRYYHDPELLQVIVRAGDPLLENMNERGQWMFAKKDGSTWGMIWMPWTYSRWIRTFALVRDDMPADKRQARERALQLGYTGIAASQLGHVHNIPSHHAMGLYVAGQVFQRPEWSRQAAEFLVKVAGQQSEGGYWSEGVGPVVLYNFVYLDALGTYYAQSHDQRVLPALQRAADFHRHFTYPGGQNVETIDQRNPYHETISAGNAGFTFSPAGRSYLQNQWSRYGWDRLDADLIASLLLYGEEGPCAEAAPGEDQHVFVLDEAGTARAATIQRGPWFICLSAYVAPVPSSRWIQDRQNLLSIYHGQHGLIVGGGNTKLQPLWSNYTVGDPSLLAHRPGDENPDFRPRGELYHVPSAAALAVEPQPELTLTYGPEECRIGVEVKDERTIVLGLETTCRSDLPVAAHLTLLPRLGQTIETAAGEKAVIGEEAMSFSAERIGDWLRHAGCRFTLPAGASLHWPALPHNPYRKDGRAGPAEGRLVVRIPLDRQHPRQRVTLTAEP